MKDEMKLKNNEVTLYYTFAVDGNKLSTMVRNDRDSR